MATRRRRALLLTLAPLPLLALLGHRLANDAAARMANRAGTDLSTAADAVDSQLAEPAEPTPLPPAPESELVPLDEDAVAPASSTSARAAPKLPPPKGLLVSRKRVVEAANAGHRPSATPVAATSYRPAGVALSGVSATGAGLVDGDVLTRIAGAPATSPGVVVGAVTGALRHKAPSISGEVWRDTQRIVVTVELPDIEPPTP